jgi:hypothetical protein
MRNTLLAVLASGILGPGLMAQPPKPDPPAAVKRDGPARPAYEMRMLQMGDTYQGIRFKPATGEAWQIVRDRWEKLPETGPVPAGDYDLMLIPAKDTLVAIRFDRATGATWMLQSRKWSAFQEPAAAPGGGRPAAAGPPRYEVRYALAGENLHLVRFDTRTGASAKVEGDTYQTLAESGPVPPGDYDVTVVATGKTWMAFRVDRSTGATWLMTNNRWQKVGEPD